LSGGKEVEKLVTKKCVSGCDRPSVAANSLWMLSICGILSQAVIVGCIQNVVQGDIYDFHEFYKQFGVSQNTSKIGYD
jgi:hypothetical protein